MSTSAERAIRWLFYALGAILTLAVPAIFLPTEWMASLHTRLGLGEMPQAPLVDYLTRSAAALYAMQAGLFFLGARDPRRYRGLVLYLGAADLVFGLVVLGIDLHAGLPAHWTLTEGPPTAAIGAVIYWLGRRIPEPGPPGR